MSTFTKISDTEAIEKEDQIKENLPFDFDSSDTGNPPSPVGNDLSVSRHNRIPLHQIINEIESIKIDKDDEQKLPIINEDNCFKYEIDRIEKAANHQFKVERLGSWQECDLDTIKGLVEGDNLKSGDDKFENILERVREQDILSAEEIERRYPRFDPRFYEFLEQASRDKFKILTHQAEPVITSEEGEFKLNFN